MGVGGRAGGCSLSKVTLAQAITGPKAVWEPNGGALVSTFCVSGSVPGIPRSNQMVEAYGRGVGHGSGKEKEKGRGPMCLEQTLCSVLKALKIPLHFIVRTCLGGGDFKNKGTGV